MKDRTFFVWAVFIAVCVPVVLGSGYFYFVSQDRGSNSTIASLENKRELVLFGDTTIEEISDEIIEDENYKLANSIDFEVDYASGPDPISVYRLILRDVRLDRYLDGSSVSWSLFILNIDEEEVAQVANGTFKEADENFLLLEAPIAITDTHRYRLYYYLNEEVKNKKIFARVAVE